MDTESYFIRSCPFCGSHELIFSETDCGENVQEYAIIVVCGNCGTCGPWAKNYEESASLWNRRRRSFARSGGVEVEI